LERDFISARTKEALAKRKSEGMKLGRPIGPARTLRLDVHADKIEIGTAKPIEIDGASATVSLGATLFEYNAPPVTSATQGALFVSDGTSPGAPSAGKLYFRPASSGAPVGIRTSDTTLQEAYAAGSTITLSGAAAPVAITAGAVSPASFLQLKSSSSVALFAIDQTGASDISLSSLNATASGVAGTTLILKAGSAIAGNANGGSILLKTGASSGSGTLGVFGFSDAGGNTVSIGVDSTIVGVPFLRTQGTGTWGVTLGPVVLNAFSNQSTTPFTLQKNVAYYGCNTSLGAISLFLPSAANAVQGQTIIIKDETGNSAANNVTIAVSGGGNIDGVPSHLLNTPYKSLQFLFSGGLWHLV
jgi:hypothetical protein